MAGRFYFLWLLFLALKLTGHIDWSWWVVFIPLVVDVSGVSISLVKKERDE